MIDFSPKRRPLFFLLFGVFLTLLTLYAMDRLPTTAVEPQQPLAESLATGDLANLSKISSHAYLSLRLFGHSYAVYLAHPKEQGIKLVWSEGELGSHRNVKAELNRKGQHLFLVTNAGMYHAGGKPVGLYIEQGEVIHEIEVDKSQSGNFYLQPNGVFYISKKGDVFVTTTDRFVEEGLIDQAYYATQSGPMLLIDGLINAQFGAESQNLRLRSGVGVGEDGTVYIIISNDQTNFYDFASVFERFGCKNALFLDGVISQLFVDPRQNAQVESHPGPMIVIHD